MTMPSIADVKAAISRWDAAQAWIKNMPPGSYGPEVATMAEHWEADHHVAHQFIRAVLNAPGMTAERLSEIQRIDPEAEADSDHGWNALAAVPELIAEVLRLRAELADRMEKVINFLSYPPAPKEVLDAMTLVPTDENR